MTLKTINNLIAVIALVVLLVGLSSCNRGMGCPNNFSIGEATSPPVEVIDAAGEWCKPA